MSSELCSILSDIGCRVSGQGNAWFRSTTRRNVIIQDCHFAKGASGSLFYCRLHLKEKYLISSERALLRAHQTPLVQFLTPLEDSFWNKCWLILLARKDLDIWIDSYDDWNSKVLQRNQRFRIYRPKWRWKRCVRSHFSTAEAGHQHTQRRPTGFFRNWIT
jgi:hypothetical protein